MMWDRLPARGSPALGTLGERAASGRAVEPWRDLTINRLDPCRRCEFRYARVDCRALERLLQGLAT
ncbi:MAG: hypothetical protein QME92_09730 [Bacillota bacterium]|nr:hypothetical protein [Bacillota bacterium]